MYQVRHPALGDPPPGLLRAGRRGGATLPIPPGRFVGREAQSRRIAAAFETTRLVTLCGTGGVGKTRLAVEFAGSINEPFTAGPRFVDLTRARDGPGLLSKLADALAIRLPPGADSIDSITPSIAATHVLVVLDNCEHLIDSVAQYVAGLLRACPNVGVLATSREPLRVRGERVIEVPPLPMGSPSSPGPAVELLVDRARSADAVVDDDDPALHTLVRAVDGLPLALELMAPRLSQMKPAELAEQLAEFGLLVSIDGTGGRRRDVQLRTTFDWSYGLLDEPAQRLFAALSVCVGGTTIEGARHLMTAACVPDGDPRVILSELVDESLVIVDTSGVRSRYRMLQPVREFAAERLMELGWASAVEKAHVSYLATFTEREAAGLRGPAEANSVERLNAEFDNLRAAARWCAQHHDADLGFRIVAPLVDHLLARGRFEVGTWSQAIADVPGAERDPRFPVGLGLAALTAMEGGRLADADALSARAVAAGEQLGRPSWIPYSVRVLLTAAGQVDADLRTALRALREVADAADDSLGQAVYHFDRATIMKYGPTPGRVLSSAAELESIGHAIGSPSILAMGLMVKGWGLAAESRPAEAAEALRQSITLAASVGNTSIAEIAQRDLLDVEHASLEAYGATLREFLDQNDVAQGIATVLAMLPSVLDLEAYEAAARVCGWLLSTPWATSAQLHEAMRRLDEHLDPAAAATARQAGERMTLEQLAVSVQTAVGDLYDKQPLRPIG